MIGFRAHLDERTIALYAGGDLGRIRRWLANRHLSRCPICRDAVAAYSDVLSRLAEAPPVPEIDFSALAHNVRVTAEQSPPVPSTETRWRWRAAAGAGLATAAIATLMLVSNSNESKPDPTLTATAVPAVPEELGPWAEADVQLTSAGSLRVQSFHSGSGTLTITDYYLP